MKQNRQKTKKLEKQHLKMLKEQREGKQDSNVKPRFLSGHVGHARSKKLKALAEEVKK